MLIIHKLLQNKEKAKNSRIRLWGLGPLGLQRTSQEELLEAQHMGQRASAHMGHVLGNHYTQLPCAHPQPPPGFQARFVHGEYMFLCVCFHDTGD